MTLPSGGISLVDTADLHHTLQLILVTAVYFCYGYCFHFLAIIVAVPFTSQHIWSNYGCRRHGSKVCFLLKVDHRVGLNHQAGDAPGTACVWASTTISQPGWWKGCTRAWKFWGKTCRKGTQKRMMDRGGEKKFRLQKMKNKITLFG